MKISIRLMVITALFSSFNAWSFNNSGPTAGVVKGRVTDAGGAPLKGASIIVEHTVWHASYVKAVTDNKGYYNLPLPAQPSGSWTIKAQIERQGYGQKYKFDLHPSTSAPFKSSDAVARDFTWKLSGPRPESKGVYGARVDLYSFGLSIPLEDVKLIFLPKEKTLIDGGPAVRIEKNVVNVAGTDMANDIPIGVYTVQAVHARTGKPLLLDNRKDGSDAPARDKMVIFGKHAYLADTEYNIEFSVSE